MPLIKPKTISRIACVQSIYCHYAINLDINKVLKDIIEFYETEKVQQDEELITLKLNKKHLVDLTLAVVDNINQIDQLIEDNLTVNWTLAKLHLTLLSILRAGIAELRYFPDTPFKVVISEFSDIAGNMLAENEVAFVNSILQKINDQNQKSSVLNDDPFA
jgi:N utilization substance protein B